MFSSSTFNLNRKLVTLIDQYQVDKKSIFVEMSCKYSVKFVWCMHFFSYDIHNKLFFRRRAIQYSTNQSTWFLAFHQHTNNRNFVDFCFRMDHCMCLCKDKSTKTREKLRCFSITWWENILHRIDPISILIVNANESFCKLRFAIFQAPFASYFTLVPLASTAAVIVAALIRNICAKYVSWIIPKWVFFPLLLLLCSLLELIITRF